MQQNYLFIFLLFCFFCCSLFSQSPLETKEPFAKVVSIKILADKNYAFEQVVNDSSLNAQFVADPLLRDFQQVTHYWVKVTLQNTTMYSQPCYVSIFPMLDFTFYQYDLTTTKWQSLHAGLAAPYLSRRVSTVPCMLSAQQTTTVYIHNRVSALAPYPYPISIGISLEKAKDYEAREQQFFTLWIATLAVMFTFFLYNAYIYFIFKDDTYLHYLIIVIGGMIYITGLNKFYNVLFFYRIFNIEMTPNGNIYFFEASSGTVQIGIFLIITGFIQLTRSYLQTRSQLPFWDKVLFHVNWIFVTFFSISSAITLSGIAYLDNYIARFENLSTISIILLLFSVGILSYRKKFKPAKYFLLANSLPLFLIILLAGYFAIYRFYGKNVMFLPNLAIISQTLTFAVALVARIHLLKEELNEKKREAQNLQNEKEQLELQSKLIELENEYIHAEMQVAKEQTEKLQEKLAFNQRELASITLHIHQKNELLANLQKQIEKLPKTPVHEASLKLIQSTIQNNMYLEADWEKFRLHFEQVHPDFFKNLTEKHPNLTAHEIRLSAYLHLNLSTKEIASLLNIAPASVLTAKMRLNKKLNNNEVKEAE
ncbi:MAG: 7TM diverse intracellular signaling domain-containing protein [Bacteroidia bacterium]